MSHDCHALHVAIAGFGDVGQTYARALMERGQSVGVFHPAPRQAALEAARSMGLTIQRDPSTAFANADLVLNVAPGSQALPVARAAAPHLMAGALFADLSSASPADLREAASLFVKSAYVDAAIMGAVSIHAHRTPLLASGDHASRLQALLAPLEFTVDVLPDSKPGDATGLKLIRSVLTKGMDAVITECLLVAEAMGMSKLLLSHIGDLDRSTLSELIAMFVRTHAPHALRRMHEVQTVETTLGDLGVPLIVTSAVRQRFARTVTTLGANPTLPGDDSHKDIYERVLPWMLNAEREHSHES